MMAFVDQVIELAARRLRAKPNVEHPLGIDKSLANL